MISLFFRFALRALQFTRYSSFATLRSFTCCRTRCVYLRYARVHALFTTTIYRLGVRSPCVGRTLHLILIRSRYVTTPAICLFWILPHLICPVLRTWVDLIPVDFTFTFVYVSHALFGRYPPVTFTFTLIFTTRSIFWRPPRPLCRTTHTTHARYRLRCPDSCRLVCPRAAPGFAFGYTARCTHRVLHVLRLRTAFTSCLTLRSRWEPLYRDRSHAFTFTRLDYAPLRVTHTYARFHAYGLFSFVLVVAFLAFATSTCHHHTTHTCVCMHCLFLCTALTR